MSDTFFLRQRGDLEVLKYYLIFGGVPKYLEDIDVRLSFLQNLEKLTFSENALLIDEFEKIFNVHFKEPRVYLKIVKALTKLPLNLEGISGNLGLKSSGGVKNYLENLELAEFIRFIPDVFSKSGKSGKYKASDEFVNYYVKFILTNKRLIQSAGSFELLNHKILSQLDIWLGFAFENLINNNALALAKKMGFLKYVESFGSYFSKSKVQVDLIYIRSDNTISVCEAKFHSKPVSTQIIPEFQKKLACLPIPSKYSVHKILITASGATDSLRDAEYFDVILDAKDLLYS
jgi:hypothetical protein